MASKTKEKLRLRLSGAHQLTCVNVRDAGHTLYDGAAYSNTATVSLFVGNHAPSAANDSKVVNEDDELIITTANLVSNDSDADGDTLTFSIDTLPEYGELIDNSNGTFTYVPYWGFNGTDSYTYEISDGYGGTDTATVSITVNPLIYFETSEYFADQSDTATITVCLTGISSEDITVHYATSDGTAEASEDYTSASGTVTIPAGYTSATFNISTLTDSGAADDEMFTIELSSPTDAGMGWLTEANFTIFVEPLTETERLNLLNGLSNAIDDRLDEIGNVENTTGLMEDIDLALMIMESNAFLMNTASIDEEVGDFRDALTDYENARAAQNPASLNNVVADILNKASQAIRSATEAAQESQGHLFRVRGLADDMNNMIIYQLEPIFDRIDALQGVISAIDMSPFATYSDLQTSRITTMLNNLEYLKVGLDFRAGEAAQVVTVGLSVTATVQSIIDLNAQFDYVEDLRTIDAAFVHGFFLMYRDDAADARPDVMQGSYWWDYNAALANLGSYSGTMHEVIAGNSQNYQSAVQELTEAKEDFAIGDLLAAKGVRYFRVAFTEFLQAEYDILSSEGTFVANAPLGGDRDAAMDNIVTYLGILDAALTTLSTV